MENIPIINDEISLKEFFLKIREWRNYLISKWKIIFIVVLTGSVLGLTFSVFIKPTYTAVLSFALEDEKGGAGGGLSSALGLAGSLGLDLGGGGGGIFTSANLTVLFKSRAMVEKTLLTPVNLNGREISLAEMYIENNEWRESWKKNPKLINIKFLPSRDRKGLSRTHDSILGVIFQNLSKGMLEVGQKDKKVGIVTIEVISTNELFAKYFCEALANEVGRFYVDTKSKKARMNMSILQHQTDSIRKELNGALTGVAVANDNTFNLNPALNVRRTPFARKQVDVQANTAILTELVKQSELSKVTLRKETPLIQVIDTPILPLTKTKFGKAKGILVGGFIAGFLAVIVLIGRRLFRTIVD